MYLSRHYLGEFQLNLAMVEYCQSTNMIGGSVKNARAFGESQKQKNSGSSVCQPHVRVPGHDESACLTSGQLKSGVYQKELNTLTHSISPFSFYSRGSILNLAVPNLPVTTYQDPHSQKSSAKIMFSRLQGLGIFLSGPVPFSPQNRSNLVYAEKSLCWELLPPGYLGLGSVCVRLGG